jgi:hypothetical protein
VAHVPETLRRRGPRFGRHGCFVSETSRVQENAFIDSCPGLVKLFGMRSPFFVLQRRSGARVPRVGGGILASADFVEAQKLRRLANPLKDCFGATPRSPRETRPGSAILVTPDHPPLPGLRRGRLITSHFSLGVSAHYRGLGRDRGVGRGLGVTRGVALRVGVAVAVGVGVSPGVLKT